MADKTRAGRILSIIEEMVDNENNPQHALNNATGYTYQDRGRKGDAGQMPNGKKMSGLNAPAGKSA